MILNIFQFFCTVLLVSTLACNIVNADKSVSTVSESPAAVVNAMPTNEKGVQTAVFAGGCFWGLEAVFEHIKGVTDVVSGYSGGDAKTADYETVSTGTTGHAEAVKVTYDSSKVSYDQLLKVFFSVVHDPTELNRQGPDTGTQYRSAVFYNSDEQKRAAQSYIDELTKEKVFSRPIVTQVVPLKDFYKAEDYHQNYLDNHPNQPYIVVNDKPKVENLQKQFPDLYVSK
ncbi:MAG: peptide-methionine (S)-S-oxide reductase MsrA [Acidobacteriota bacterium]